MIATLSRSTHQISKENEIKKREAVDEQRMSGIKSEDRRYSFELLTSELTSSCLNKLLCCKTYGFREKTVDSYGVESTYDVRTKQILAYVF